jgi:glycine cleavage system H protein
MEEIEIPEGLSYTKSHEWARVHDSEVVVGITAYAVAEMNKEIVNVDLPQPGAIVAREDSFGVIDSVKAAFDLYAPVSGRIIAVNDELTTSPELVATSPYRQGWMVRISMEKPEELESLLSATQYRDLIKQEKHQ